MDPSSMREKKREEAKKESRKKKVSEQDWVTFIVGGVHFATQRSTLDNVPNTLLADLRPRSPHYDPRLDAYVFDRNPYLFPYILDFYRTGVMHFPHSFCGPVMQRELLYWGIEETVIAPCCWNRYREYHEQEQTLHSIGKAFNVVDRFEEKKRTNFFLSNIHKIRSAIWYFLEDPTSSIPAQVEDAYFILHVCTILRGLPPYMLILQTRQHFSNIQSYCLYYSIL